MDKFTKTTEMDISAMSDMENSTPKKSKLGSIISIIFCLLIAVVIWLFAMENDVTEHTREFNDIQVNLIGNNDYTVSGDLNIDVVLIGANKDLADIKKEDIYVILDFSKINNIISNTEHDYSVDIHLPEELSERVFSEDATVKLTINKKS